MSLNINNNLSDILPIPLPTGITTDSDKNPDQVETDINEDIDVLIKNLNLLGGSINELKAKGFSPKTIESLVEGIIAGKSLTDLKAMGFSSEDIQSVTEGIKLVKAAEKNLINELVQNFEKTFDEKSIADGPKIPPPSNQTITPSSSNNPWFNVSFLAVLHLVMADVFKLQQRGHYLEAQVAIQANKTTIDVGKDIAALTLASYEAQAQEKIIEAVSAFVQAAVHFVGAVQSHANVGKGQRMAKENLAKQKQNVDTIRAEEGIQVGSNPNTASKSKRLQKAEDRYANQKAGLSDQAFNHTRQLNESHRIITDMTTQMVSGTSSLLIAELKREQGQIESLKQIYESYQSVLRTYASNSQEASTNQQQALDRTMDFLGKITDSTFRSFSLSHGA